MSATDYRRRAVLQDIADQTMKVLGAGSLADPNGKTHRLHIEKSEEGTMFYSPNMLSDWATPPRRREDRKPVHTSIIETSTIDAALMLSRTLQRVPSERGSIGVLNFASATKPGGGFLNGAQAQEPSLARASTLYPTLRTRSARQFYETHQHVNPSPYYTHAMIFSPDVEIFRADDGRWMPPFTVDIVTSAAVNAKEVRQERYGGPPHVTEENIERVMRERMARILFLFELQGARNLVLGSFGTGVFCNDINVVARLWAELLTGPEARFGRSFDRVVFAILERTTFTNFANVFESFSTEEDRSH